ncbi:phytoene desaturase family protein [Planctomycetota bacterium]
MSDFDTIVIGSGAGGLTAALSLARFGHRVLVLEQHSLPGGWCHSFALNGFLFSPGVHYIGQLHPGGRLRKIYEGLGVANDLTFLELNPDGFDHVITGDRQFDIPKGRDRYVARLQEEFPSEAQNLLSLFRIIDSLANVNGTRRGVMNKLQLVTVGLRSMDHLLNRVGIQDERLRAILTIQSGDHGMAPSEAPAALHAAVMAHYFEGAYYPMGGARSLPRAFIRALARHDGEIRVRTPVVRILVEGTGRRRRAVGVGLADGTTISADQVVSNADPHITFEKLIGKEHLSRRLQKRLSHTEYSHSALSLFCATDLDLESMGFDSGNYWYSATGRVEDLYDQANRVSHEADDLPGIFLTITTLKDRSKRKDRLHTIECFSLASYDPFHKWQDSHYGDRPEDYEIFKNKLREKMLRRMNELIPDLSKHIVFSELGTPLTKAHYIHATRGSLYGTAKRWNQIGPWAYPVQTEIQGLFMCGASTEAHGVAGVTETGITAAKKIAKCRARDFLNEQDQHLTILPCDDVNAWAASMHTAVTEQCID